MASAERQEVKAVAKWVHTSPRKARLVVEHIRGRSVPEARTVLAFTQRAAARDVAKVLSSAVANAEANHNLVGDELIVAAAYVDEGPVLKRWRARARGRAARIQKPTCHITIKLGRVAERAARSAARSRSPSEDDEAELPRRPRQRDEKKEGRAEKPRRTCEEERRPALMGQKIHPGGLRVGVIHDWKSNWYTGTKEFPAYLLEDIKIRKHIYGKLAHAGLSDILIRKDKQRITIDIYTARPGIVIGKSGVEVDALRKDVHGMTNKAVHININEIKRPELDAKLVAQSIAEQLANRVSFRRAMKRSLASAMRSGAQGVKVQCGGRLGGGEMSRSESYSEGRVPLHTIRADIDYGFVEAKTTFGRIGVKVWINKGEIMPEGYEGVAQKDARLGDQDTARRRGGTSEGLGASREGGRGRGPDREGLGPVRQRKKGSGGPRRPGGRGSCARAGEHRAQAARGQAPPTEEPTQQPPVEPEVTGRRRKRNAAPETPAEAPAEAPKPDETEEKGES